MMKIIPRPSATLAFGWLVLFMGVNSVNIFSVESLNESTVSTALYPKTTLIMDLRITNRIYNDSLNDQDSEEYKSLRQEVEQLFFDVYGPTSLAYLGTDHMTFRNGSVIASAQMLFGTTMINPVLERSFFLSMYRQIPSPALEIDVDYVASPNTVDVFAVDSPIENTVLTTPQPKTKFDMEIRITNRIYNNTLNDLDSEEYISLRQEVEQLFFDVYSPTPLLYVGTDQITFRNGSVIARAELLFETTMINPVLERNLFLSRYRDLTSPQLRIDFDYVENQLPHQPVEDVNTTTPTTPLTTTPSMTTPLTSTPNITTQTTIPTSHSTSTIPPTHTTTLSFSTVVDNTTYTLHSTSGNNTTYMLHSTSINSTSTPLNNTMHPSTNETQSPENMDITGGAITAAPNATNTTSSSTPKDTMSTSIHNTINSISTVSSSISTVSSISTDSPTKTATVVPDWGIALLVLAAISLLLLIILLIILLVMCCCKKNRRTFVKESEAITPTMYFNPDIPMYSTHSIIDSANGKQADVREKPPANRTGMYVVNK